MPKSLEEFRQLQSVEERRGGRKITEGWDTVAKKITETGLAYTVKEVWESKQLVDKRVGQYRTKNALDKLVEEGKLSRLYDGKRFWYGPPEKPVNKSKGARK